MDFRDWFILIHVNALVIAATIFVFQHADPVNFATWGGVVGTVTGAYHYLFVKDQKAPDAPP